MSDLALSLKNNAKRFWTFCRWNTNSRQIPAVVSDGQNDVTDAADKAVLRECADELAPSLTTLFSLSMSTCTSPEV